jgi:myo-inositol 2-dehydrogenase / D-chiro-inositol 1-dehydrogenase
LHLSRFIVRYHPRLPYIWLVAAQPQLHYGRSISIIRMKRENLPTRRQFLKTSSAAAVAGSLAGPFVLPGNSQAAAPNSETLKIGLIGCGGRGGGAIRNALSADDNVRVTAMGDAFPESLFGLLNSLKRNEKLAEKLDVEPQNCFVGLDAYHKVIQSGVDVVVLATPPGFRPVHLRAAVEAGKHVFCEKPMATDAAGVRSVLESAAIAKQKKLGLVAGFCWRYDFARREFYKRIHEGELGDIRSIYATYYTGPVKPMPPANTRPAGMGDIEWQIRNSCSFVWLSGDGLVEQAVHSVDKIAWAMRDQPPLKAVATGGRQIPAHGGNIYDHFHIVYEYPEGVRAFMGCRQQTNCYGENNDYLMGTKANGTIGRGAPAIIGENRWRYSGPANDMYQTEHDELFASIRAGHPINDGVWMSHSTMLAIMGRMAAYTGQEVTWEQALNSKEQIVPERLDLNMDHPVPPLALPGRTALV